MRHCMVFAVLLLLFVATADVADADEVTATPSSKALTYGEKIYRQGILSDGTPLLAYVQDDIPVDGRTFTCIDCHQRSGLGSYEGTIITPRTNGRDLYQPWRRTGAWRQPDDEKSRVSGREALPLQFRAPDHRPAYTRASLAEAITLGIDPAGRELNRVMPRYELNKTEMGYLTAYLEALSGKYSPGVDETTIRFATVVTEGVNEADREAMLKVLRAIVEDKNRQPRHEEKRAAKGPFFDSEMNESFRRLELAVWELKGERSTWPEQLNAYYAASPVFALLGGMAAGEWTPIHEFCEKFAIPCILPVTDRPVISKSDWYTLYFSKGYYQEGEAAARFLLGEEKQVKRVVHVYRDGGDGGLPAKGFDSAWEAAGRPAPEKVILAVSEPAGPALLQLRKRQERPDVILCWFRGDDLPALGEIGGDEGGGPRIIISSSLAGENFSSVPEKILPLLSIIYPYELPAERGRVTVALENWLKVRKITPGSTIIQSKIYFLGGMLASALGSMRNDYYRDHFLEGFDMMIDQTYAIAAYPRLSFGPGQRYASKGCYVVQLTPPPVRLVKRSGWLTH